MGSSVQRCFRSSTHRTISGREWVTFELENAGATNAEREAAALAQLNAMDPALIDVMASAPSQILPTMPLGYLPPTT
jgi:hypothetical protein